MKTISKLFLAVVLAGAMSSCGMMMTKAGPGFIYTEVAEGETATSNAMGSKVGTAQAKNILGAVAIGDASVETAAKSAGITRISHVDNKKTSILGIYSTYTVYVYGE